MLRFNPEREVNASNDIYWLSEIIFYVSPYDCRCNRMELQAGVTGYNMGAMLYASAHSKANYFCSRALAAS
jgi:hypothetical protein